MMKRSIKNMVGVLAVLLASATVQAELKLVVNFEGLSGSPDGKACNGVLGGVLDTQTEGTGNIDIGAIDGSTAMLVNGLSSGADPRAAGFSGIANPIDDSEAGIGLFRFMIRSSAGRPVRSHIGLIADATDNPITSTNAQNPMTVPAGFRLVDNGTGFNIVTTDGATVLKAGLVKARWYNVWIVADNAADTFDLFLSTATGPGGAATLPNPEDLVKSGIPFGVATNAPLTGMIFANPSGTGQAERIYVDDIWWDGDQGLAKPIAAKKPSPVAGESDVRPDVILSWTPGPFAATHDVYFGTSRVDVDSATTANPLSTLASAGQDANTFDPAGLLELEQTYYWRVDEVNAAPDFTIIKGPVWSFTVEPYAYVMKNVTATASSSHNADMGPEKTTNSSGLDAAGLHGTTDNTMWLSNATAAKPAWIQYEFDRVYKLQEMWVWNSNQSVEVTTTGFGAKGVTIEYSSDMSIWTTLGTAHEFAQATGLPGYAHNTTVDFGGVAARYVRLTINTTWGTSPQCGLSEVRFYYVPVRAREPQPAAAATGISPDVVLSWRAGREAVSHQLYLSTDKQTVVDGTAVAVTPAQTSYAPSSLALGTTYYWKVVEVNQAASPDAWESDVWSFSTSEYIAIDDFESYTNESPNRIFQAWVDGYGFSADEFFPAGNPGNGTGAGVGHDIWTLGGANYGKTIAETAIVHGGKQSMPLYYDNSSQATSEADRTWTTAQNWTTNAADTLRLWVQGNPEAYVDNAGVITMSGTGHDIWDDADDFRFACQSLSGNGSVIVKVESLVITNGWAKAGVMIRQNLDADSKFAYMIVSATQGVSFGWRPLTAGTCSSVNQAGVAAPQWVKLTRTGDAFTAQYSADGKTWLDVKNADGTIATTSVAMANPVYVGLCVTSHNVAASTVAVMSSRQTTGAVSGQWQVAAIGDDPQPVNSPANLYVTIQDSTSKTATAVNPTAVTTAVWTEWKIPLSDFAGVNLKAVKKIVIGVGDKAKPTLGGTGLIYLDDIGFGRPASQ